VSAQRTIVANGMTSLRAYTEPVPGFRDMVNRGFCRASGKASRKTTRVAFEQCLVQIETQDDPNCSAAVSAR
jgi:hypothetical protein